MPVELTVEEIALAYSLAVSPIRTDRVAEFLQSQRADFNSGKRLLIAETVNQLRGERNDFIIGDHVSFYYRGRQYEGIIYQVSDDGECVKIETEQFGTFKVLSYRCDFLD